MKINIILASMITALTLGFMGCTASVTTGNNANASKPANTTNTASTPAPSNANSDKDKADSGSKSDLDFSLVNKTGYDIKGVSIGPAGDTDWHADDEVLKGRTFKDGASLDIKFSPKAKSAKWDMNIEWSDGDPAVEWHDIDLTTVKKLTLKYDKTSGKTSIE